MLPLVFILSAHGQHRVDVTTPEGDKFTISGDTLKYNFKATVGYYEGDFDKAAKYQLKAIENEEFDSDLHMAYFDLSCYLSLTNDTKSSAKYLDKSFAMGYDDIPHVLYDKDLDNLRLSKHWNSIVEPNISAYFDKHNREIAMMFNDDQRARTNSNTINWDSLAIKDKERRTAIRNLIQKKMVKTNHDYYKSAFIMHHGNEIADYELANELAEKAISFKNLHPMALWLSAASKDRLLLKKEQPQWYGTQGQVYLKSINKMGIDYRKIDTTMVTPEERLYRNAPNINLLREYIQNFKEARKLYIHQKNEKEILGVYPKAFEKEVKSKNASAIRQLYSNDSVALNVTIKSKDLSQYYFQALSKEWALMVQDQIKELYELKISDVNLTIRKGFAVSDARFDEYFDGQHSADGYDLFTYVKTIDGWKISNMDVTLAQDKDNLIEREVETYNKDALMSTIAELKKGFKSYDLSAINFLRSREGITLNQFDNNTLSNSQKVDVNLFSNIAHEYQIKNKDFVFDKPNIVDGHMAYIIGKNNDIDIIATLVHQSDKWLVTSVNVNDYMKSK